jgi:transketolase
MPVSTIGAPFDPDMCQRESTRLAFGQAVVDLGERDADVVFLTADGTTPTGTVEFFKRFPERAFNVGIAEQNVMGVAAGMASCGLVPIVGGYAPFLAFRSLEQLRNDIAYTEFHVIVGGVYSGISMYAGGSTHHTLEDLATLRSIANMTVITPADAREAYKATIAAVRHPGPVFIRLGGRTSEPVLYTDDYDFQIGKAIQIRDGKDATIIATGPTVVYAAIASDILREEGLSIRVLNMHTVKPLDEEAIERAAHETGRILTVEEHNVLGGLGGAVAEVVTSECPVPVKRLGIPDIFASIGPLYELQRKYGLTHEGIASSVRELVSK